jgi:hypothetical protein
MSGVLRRSPGPETVFGPGYWLPRSDGFGVLTGDGRRGVVERIVEGPGGPTLLVRLRDARLYVDAEQVVDLDSAARVVSIEIEDSGG